MFAPTATIPGVRSSLPTSFEPHFRTISLVELPATDMLPGQWHDSA
jgi:hypothetical protein